MAFGGLRGTLTGLGTSIVTPETADGSVAVSVQDLIVVMVAEAAANTVTTVTDNLGQTYTAINAGTLSSVGLRGYYRYVTVAGTLTQVSCAMTSSSNDHAISVAVYEGPFTSTPLDRAPANTIDAATPYTCAATTVLSQANELIVAGLGLVRCQTATATSPNTLAINTLSAAANTNNACSSTIGYQVVAATTSVTPVFASSGTITGGVQIVATFRQGVFDSARAAASSAGTVTGGGRSDIARAGSAAAVATATGGGRSDVARAGSAGAVSTATGVSPAAGAATDYILRWNLASGTGTDLSGHSNDGVFNGGITPITGGPIGNAATFDGSSGYVQNDQIINQPYVSISLWIRTTASGYYHICGFSDTSGQHDKEINLNPGGTIVWYTSAGGYLYSASAVNGGAWHHIVCTIDATAQRIYIDGVLDATSAGGASYASYITPTPHLGATAAGGYGWLAATYDDFRVYDRALTASEATALFDEGDPFYELPRYLVSGYTPSSDRNNYTGQTGVKFRARFALAYNRLGLRRGTGSTGYHTVNLYTFPGAGVVLGTPLRTAEVDLTSGTVGDFNYADIAEITLTPDVDYFLVAETTASDGQSWSDGGAVTLLGVTPGFTYYAFAAPDNLAQTRVDLPNQMAQGVDLALFEVVVAADTGVGTAAASALAYGDGSKGVSAAGAAAAAGAASAAGRADFVSAGSATGLGTASAGGRADVSASSNVTATGTASATGRADLVATAAASATATVAATATSDIRSVGSASALGSAAGASAAGVDAYGAGATAGTGVAGATARSDARSAGSSTATGTATGTGSATGLDNYGVGTASGVGLASAAWRADIRSAASSSAVGVATGASSLTGLDSYGVGTAAAAGLAGATARSDVRSLAASTATGVAAGSSSASGLDSNAAGAAAAAGLAGATSNSDVRSLAASSAAGIATGSSSSELNVFGVGAASGVGLGQAAGRSDVYSSASAISIGVVLGASSSELHVFGVGAAVGIAIATSSGYADFRASGSAASISNASATGNAGRAGEATAGAISTAIGIADVGYTTGVAASTGTAAGAGRLDVRVVANATATGTAASNGRADFRAAGNSAAAGFARAVMLVVGQATSTSTAIAAGRSDIRRSGLAAGLSFADAFAKSDIRSVAISVSLGHAVSFSVEPGSTTKTIKIRGYMPAPISLTGHMPPAVVLAGSPTTASLAGNTPATIALTGQRIDHIDLTGDMGV